MGRWQPGASGRLQVAALDLYQAQGFEGTTVAQIADRAGVTERTFFRHFADKREVLFAGSNVLRGMLLEALEAVPTTSPPLAAVGAALATASGMLTDRPRSRQRQAVIEATPELRERELSKLATWADALGEALRARGASELTAALAAETGVAAFRVAFERWLHSEDDRSLAVHLDEALRALTTLATKSGRTTAKARPV
jgi:AcrR family transcriptional regulator